jgi:hypothetical protein
MIKIKRYVLILHVFSSTCTEKLVSATAAATTTASSPWFVSLGTGFIDF